MADRLHDLLVAEPALNGVVGEIGRPGAARAFPIGRMTTRAVLAKKVPGSRWSWRWCLRSCRLRSDCRGIADASRSHVHYVLFAIHIQEDSRVSSTQKRNLRRIVRAYGRNEKQQKCGKACV